VSLHASRKVVFFESQSHTLELVSQNDARTELKLAMAKPGKITDDFVLTFTMAEAEIPTAVFGRTDAGSSAMVSFVPKFCHLSNE
jgi:hypothetical protein